MTTSDFALMDTQAFEFSLGTTLLFAEHVLMCKEANKSPISEVRVLAKEKTPFLKTVILPLLSSYLGSAQVHMVEEKEEVGEPIFPPKNFPRNKDAFDSITPFSEYYQKRHSLPKLIPNKSIQAQANDFLTPFLEDNKEIITIHLKNKQGFESNSDQKSWGMFFAQCIQDCPNALFVIIGDDEVLEEIILLENVVLARESELPLAVQLALIPQSSLYMGMCTGPFIAALLSTTPYLIFKHPDHHADVMEIDLQGGERYVFSQQNQKLIRKLDTFTEIMKQFAKLRKGL